MTPPLSLFDKTYYEQQDQSADNCGYDVAASGLRVKTEPWRKNACNAGAKNSYDDVTDYSKAITPASQPAMPPIMIHATTDSGANMCFSILLSQCLNARKPHWLRFRLLAFQRPID